MSLLLHLSRRAPRVKEEDHVKEEDRVKEEDHVKEEDQVKEEKVPDPQVGEKRKAVDRGEEVEVEYGREVLEELSRAFRGWVEGREWLNVRLCVSWFKSQLRWIAEPTPVSLAAILLTSRTGRPGVSGLAVGDVQIALGCAE